MGSKFTPHWLHRLVFVIAALEVVAVSGTIALLVFNRGSDPLGRAIADGITKVLAGFLVLGPLPALALAWRERFIWIAAALAVLGPVVLIWVWGRL